MSTIGRNSASVGENSAREMEMGILKQSIIIS